MQMSDCPKFKRCSAPLCPLDADWGMRTYRKGEPICFYLLEYVKVGARGRFQGCIPTQFYKVIGECIDDVCYRYAPLRKALERAKRTGSRIKSPGQSNTDEIAQKAIERR